LIYSIYKTLYFIFQLYYHRKSGLEKYHSAPVICYFLTYNINKAGFEYKASFIIF